MSLLPCSPAFLSQVITLLAKLDPATTTVEAEVPASMQGGAAVSMVVKDGVQVGACKLSPGLFGPPFVPRMAHVCLQPLMCIPLAACLVCGPYSAGLHVPFFPAILTFLSPFLACSLMFAPHPHTPSRWCCPWLACLTWPRSWPA